MEKHYPLHLMAGFSQFFPSASPRWIVQAEGYEVWAAAALAPDERYHIVSAEHNARVSFTHQSAKACQTVQRRPLARWARYPAGVVVALTAQGVAVPGFYAAFISTETAALRAEYGAGMAFADLLNTMCAQRLTPRDLNELVERVRRDYIMPG